MRGHISMASTKSARWLVVAQRSKGVCTGSGSSRRQQLACL